MQSADTFISSSPMPKIPHTPRDGDLDAQLRLLEAFGVAQPAEIQSATDLTVALNAADEILTDAAQEARAGSHPVAAIAAATRRALGHQD